MIKTIKRILNINHCPKCASSNLKSGYWIRGWNNLCNQAAGDEGHRCYECGYIQWEKSYEEYVKILPHWCTPYKNK